MTALLEGLTHWHWLGLGFILLAIEVLGSVGFLLWTGIAALEVGLLLLIWPFGWQAAVAAVCGAIPAHHLGLVALATPSVTTRVRMPPAPSTRGCRAIWAAS